MSRNLKALLRAVSLSLNSSFCKAKICSRGYTLSNSCQNM